MTPEQKNIKRNIQQQKKRYETAYVNKVKYTREKTAAETKSSS